MHQNVSFFDTFSCIKKYIKMKQLGNWWDHLMTRGVNQELRNDKTIVEKSSEILLPFLLHVQDVGEIPTPCKFFVANRSENLEEPEIYTEKVLYQIDLMANREPREDMIEL